MELPSGVYRQQQQQQQQQRWNPNITDPNPNGNPGLVAYNNYEHSYNNLGFNHPNNSTTTNQRRYGQHYLDNNGNPTNTTTAFISMATSPTSKKGSQKFSQFKQMSHLVSLKSKIGVEYRRYAVARDDIAKFDEFFKRVESIHQLHGTQFVIYYSDQHGEMLPINNDDNLAKAIDTTTRLKTTHYIVASNKNTQTSFAPYHHYNHQPQQVILERPFLKLFLEKKGIPNDIYYSPNFSLKCKRKDNLINMLISSSANSSSDSRPRISMPEDFRQISSIIDADKLPTTRRRVVLKRGVSDKPLGFYISDGTYQMMNSQGGIEKHYGVFISDIVPGGLADSTNLLAINDEILEVNGIAVGKNRNLDQVRDMMVANSSNLIITTRPYNQKPANYYNRIRNRNINNPGGRDRLPSTQSTGSDLCEDYIRHHMN